MRPRARSYVIPAYAAVLLGGLALAPAALGAGDGTYKGSVGDDESAKVTIKVKDGKVAKVTAHVPASCGATNLVLTVAYPPAGKKGATARIGKGGRFRVSFKGTPDVENDKRTVSGTFSGRKVSGTIIVEGLCSAAVTYAAKR